MGFASQVKFLLYRNFLLKRRNSKQTIYEAVSVLYFVAILAVIRRTAVRPKVYSASDDSVLPRYALFPSEAKDQEPFLIKPPKEIGYVLLPGSSKQATNDFVGKLSNITGSYRIKFTSYPDEVALDDAHKAKSKNLTLGLVIKFNSTSRTVDYTIKVPYNSVPLTTTKKRREKANGMDCSTLLFFWYDVFAFHNLFIYRICLVDRLPKKEDLDSTIPIN